MSDYNPPIYNSKDSYDKLCNAINDIMNGCCDNKEFKPLEKMQMYSRRLYNSLLADEVPDEDGDTNHYAYMHYGDDGKLLGSAVIYHKGPLTRLVYNTPGNFIPLIWDPKNPDEYMIVPPYLMDKILNVLEYACLDNPNHPSQN
jgi:hypothetical protein